MKTIKKIVLASKKMLKKDHDNVFVIAGGEGSGKSNLMLHMLDMYNPDAKIEDIGFNANGFIKALKGSKRYGNPVFDEAGDGLYSRDAMTGVNKVLAKTFMAIRGLNLFTILVLPDFFDLDTYFRKHRIRGLFVVYKRGRVKFYNKRQIETINNYSHTRKIYLKPSVYDTFPKYNGHLVKEYKKMKDLKIQEALSNVGENNVTTTKKQEIEILLRYGIPAKDLVKKGYTKQVVYPIRKELITIKAISK